MSPALTSGVFTTELPGNPQNNYTFIEKKNFFFKAKTNNNKDCEASRSDPGTMATAPLRFSCVLVEKTTTTSDEEVRKGISDEEVLGRKHKRVIMTRLAIVNITFY